ncbi:MULTISPECIES: magnesium/cobalt transporter CorA [unclassified Flavobacterium]|jgi:magnesium transporter|uniref:magnesium/cobalt transporter CorA n=1 Tax=unclassified Flavobacterium TaxID=196869 RepID=UPI00057E7535|nr:MULTISPECIES: magnesium/cobalt transporter CorA [unclassified Flavobacterium]KIC02004.1 magnesium transporter [Flavobacterium sp. JRM]MEA9412356.1 magnesium/cobalt transporter CorA [Flavobacterium sp. PL02]OUL63152.1 magnesium and cobalt transport protein CorA [Flavobacterium sp. AJR]
MRKIKYKKGRKLQPYSLEYTGRHKDTQSEMQLFVYDDLEITEYENFNILALNACIDYTKNNWLNIHGLNNIDLIKTIGEYFKVDGFMLADILNTTKRTKLQEQQEILFFNIKSLLPSEDSDNISVEQISFIIKDGILISFQEKRSDFFTHIRERIRQHAGIVRTKKVDYLLYLLLDAVMENFYITLEDEENKVEELINITKGDTNPAILEEIEKHRDNFNFLKRSIIPLRDSLYDIKSIKDDNTFNGIEKENFSFFARLHQKSLELLEQIESDMSSLESASNFYFSAQSRKMNEIMKTLTIISAIFIPLTFIVGVYGMNFENIPELKYQYGYYSVMIGMFLLVIALIIYFKKRRWF